MENTRSVIKQFHTLFGENPVGTNEEISRSLTGANARKANLAAELPRNAKGELVDDWGTPFFFHQLSGTQMEIRSAGPDKQMWTADDVIVR
jgi:hypothetical protein